MTAFLGGVSNAPPLIACTSWPLELTVSAATHSQALPIRSTAPLPERPSGNDPTGLSVSVAPAALRSEEHTSELQSQSNLVCRLLLEKKKNIRHASYLSA